MASLATQSFVEGYGVNEILDLSEAFDLFTHLRRQDACPQGPMTRQLAELEQPRLVILVVRIGAR